MEFTEFELKVLEAISACRDYDDFYDEQFIETLRQIMPPTCTKNERAFLDEIREKFYYNDEDEGLTNKGNEYDILYQDTFAECNLKELANDTKTKAD